MDCLVWLLVITVVVTIVQVILLSQRKQAMHNKLAELDGFNATQTVMGADGLTGMAVDEERKLVCLLTQSGDVNLAVFPCKDILSAEIYEDGQSVQRTSRSSQLGGMLIGGLALGGVGVVLGGLTGSKLSSGKPRRIDLRVVVNSTERPIHDVNFMNVEAASGGVIHTAVMQQVRHWHGVLAVLIRRADDDDRAQISAGQPDSAAAVASVADALAKLAELKRTGLLSEEEWTAQKRKLLG